MIRGATTSFLRCHFSLAQYGSYVTRVLFQVERRLVVKRNAVDLGRQQRFADTQQKPIPRQRRTRRFHPLSATGGWRG
jgi:hypothetical protein